MEKSIEPFTVGTFRVVQCVPTKSSAMARCAPNPVTMHHFLVAQEIADIPGSERLPSGGAGSFVHPLSCHRDAQRNVVLPWWFQPTETHTGPATHDEALMSPPIASDGPG